MLSILRRALLLSLAVLGAVPLTAQQHSLPSQLDLTADITSPRLESSFHQALPEQYIWLPTGKGGGRNSSACFRSTFELAVVPRVATLYVAGPEIIRVVVNGRLLANAQRDPRSRLKPFVLSLWVGDVLRAGSNTVAVEASQGDRLLVKIVPRAQGIDAPPLMASGAGWKCSEQSAAGWERPDYDDGAWLPARVLGEPENNIDYLRWNADAGLYQWPGYDGISPYLAQLSVPAEHVLDIFEGLGRIYNAGAIAPIDMQSTEGEAARTSAGEFTVLLPPATATREEYPYILLDLGRESDGRLELASDSDAPYKVELQYGESQHEAVNEPYLGADTLLIPPHATAFGPKSAFRYALIRFLRGNSPMRFKAIRFDSIYYPVRYQASFESSDPLLNDIWRVGAYTAHLSMQDEIWDAPKRDRAPYGGDLNVSGRVIDTVFADRFLMQRTMDDLVPGSGKGVDYDVNGIPGYTAFWVMDQADFYRHLGGKEYLKSLQKTLTEVLEYMSREMDDHYLHVNPQHIFSFVDWSPGMNGDTPDVRRAVTLEFAKGFEDGAWLLEQVGDAADAAKYRAKAARIKQGAEKYLLDPATGTFGTRWQPNAMAIFSGVASEKQREVIWDKVLSHRRQFMISPYYNFYVITAMAMSGHRREALDWIREYWGGMIKEGATTFWEAYDPDWDKDNFHANLQADNGGGYYVSLCHGWSSGPTAWLIEQILGVEPQGPGFSKVSIRPDLAGLDWARGSEPTPHGPIKIDLRANGNSLSAELDLPPGVDAEVSMPVKPDTTKVLVNGRPITGRAAENGTRLVVDFDKAGTYKLSAVPPSDK